MAPGAHTGWVHSGRLASFMLAHVGVVVLGDHVGPVADVEATQTEA